MTYVITIYFQVYLEPGERRGYTLQENIDKINFKIKIFYFISLFYEQIL